MRYEIVKNFGYDGATETDSLPKAKAIATRYAHKTGNPAYVNDWARRGEIVYELA